MLDLVKPLYSAVRYCIGLPDFLMQVSLPRTHFVTGHSQARSQVSGFSTFTNLSCWPNLSRLSECLFTVARFIVFSLRLNLRTSALHPIPR